MSEATKLSDEGLKDCKALVKNLELPYLQELQSVIISEIAERRKHAVRDAAIELQKVAARFGMTVEQIMAKGAPKAKKVVQNKAPQKYRHPENAELQWTGRGQRPKWIKEWLATHDNDTSGIEIK